MNNNNATAPFTLLYLNVCSFPSRLHSWQMLVHSLDPALPTTPLLYIMTESGYQEPKPGMLGWSCSHFPGPPPAAQGFSGGGISLLYHTDCPVLPLTQHNLLIPARANTNESRTTAITWHIIQPRHRKPFLLAAVYLPPSCTKPHYLTQLTASLDTVPTLYPHLPILVVGDFNCWHNDWHQPPNVNGATACATALASWISNSDLHILNQPGQPTHISHTGALTTIDLVLTDTPTLVSSLSQLHKDRLRSDHLPFTIELALPRAQPAPRALNDRPRRQWDQFSMPEVWQQHLPAAMAAALLPLQPTLLSLPLPLAANTTAQAVIDSAYSLFEQAFLSTCLEVVGTKVIRQQTNSWFCYSGVALAYRLLLRTNTRHLRHPTDAIKATAFRKARKQWNAISAEAKLQSYSVLCNAIMDNNSKLRWTMFKRTAPSTFSALTSIVDPNGQLPSDHGASLSNLCRAFVSTAKPTLPPADPVAYLAMAQQVAAWGNLVHPTIPAHSSDTWQFGLAAVRQQCTRQHTTSAPGPDAILPIFLQYAGKAVWKALSALYSFSWRHSVTPQAWREGNVMALWKGGDKATSTSYRPISMTSIIARTFEHLVQRQLAELLDPLPPPLHHHQYFSNTQFGFRKGRTTHDAIHYLLCSVQRVLRKDCTPRRPRCPVLFLDIKKAFDRVDHNILMKRVHDAGIRGRAWLWIRSFLSNRRMRTVDNAEHSAWEAVEFGVPQGCVLSPFLFLIFINDLLRTIETDPHCNMISPLFYADDGAIAPNPHFAGDAAWTTVLYESNYLKQLSAAITHLNTWCVVSRMEFGSGKTKLVVFTAWKVPDTSPYNNLTLCGFTIGIDTHYTYLGVIFEHKLGWEMQYQHALSVARLDAARITRLTLRSHTPHFPAIYYLCKGYLIPRFSYGSSIWARHLDDSKARALQSAMIRPLRTCLSLPKTTHQLGSLIDFNLPSISSIVLTAELSHLLRVDQLPAQHPSRKLSTLSLQYNAISKPHNILSPLYALNPATYSYSRTVPAVCNNAGLVRMLSAADQNELNIPTPPVDWNKGVTFWEAKNAQRRKAAQQSYTRIIFDQVLTWSGQAIKRFTKPIIRKLGGWETHREWTQQQLQQQPDSHNTSSPLTVCKPSPGRSLYLYHDLHVHAVRRARLLANRAYTQETRHRFRKTGDTTLPHCTYAQCAAASPLLPTPIESVEHALLHCHRHDIARQQLRANLSTIDVLTPLSLSTILCATLPPPPFRRANLSSLLRYTNAFLDKVDLARGADSALVPFDPG
jgi:Reverse transcriptase (RNA-dependent DNA polymerase)/Endonuclease-reverse transcriptase